MGFYNTYVLQCVYVSAFFFCKHVLLFSVPITFFGRLYLFVSVSIYSFILYCVWALYIDACTKCFGGGPAESGYPCGAWLGRHSEIDVILITLEVAYHKGPGPVRPFVLCTRRCYTHTHTRTYVPCFPLIDLSLSLFHSFCFRMCKPSRNAENNETSWWVCMYYLFCIHNILLDNLTLSYIYI